MTAVKRCKEAPLASLQAAGEQTTGVELIIRGVVQGVGFRPFVYRLATKCNISGTIANTSQGVVIRAQAIKSDLLRFEQELRENPPPLARISSVSRREVTPTDGVQGIRIQESSAGHEPLKTLIPADIALCADCLAELLDVNDRRYRYPFINCTNCGPRFSIVKSIPYDRPGTSMADFPLCDTCLREYQDPANRRFHAQPNACPVCGPQISWHAPNGEMQPCLDPLAAAACALAEGRIVAMRGLGGFHLIADAGSSPAVARLRRKKMRQSKPLAIMLPCLEDIDAVCHLTPTAAQLLSSPAHPIVLLSKKNADGLAPELAPGMDELGIMLPYTPLHHLLFATPGCPKALVMTSGNRNGEPLCINNQDAFSSLGAIADFFLLHNREIITRVDDSVVRIMQNQPRVLRRARGYTPDAFTIPGPVPPLLACGGGLKNSFCLAQQHSAYPSQHIGDLSNGKALDFFKESIYHLQTVLQINPELAVCDLHPDYLSSRYAEELGLPLIRVQHHHAHAVAVMAEHGLQGKALAIILDGTGLGPDGTIWGGEILEVTTTGYTRCGCLAHLSLPGGDAAAEQPWRMGMAALFHSFPEEGLMSEHLPPGLQSVAEAQRSIILKMLQQQFNTPPTSSCGRLFDAVAALLGVRLHSDFEGQAAMELEVLARACPTHHAANGPPLAVVNDQNGLLVIDSHRFIRHLLQGLKAGKDSTHLAQDFHAWLVSAFSQATVRIARSRNIDTVVLGGGCLQNRLLMEGFFLALEAEGLRVYTGQEIPVNDGGLCLGQAVIGGQQYVSGCTHAGY